MFEPRDSKEILDWYPHPESDKGQGYYVMVSNSLKMVYCKSGNELCRIYNLDPSQWVTGPIWLPLSKDDVDRIHAREEYFIDRF